MPKVLICTICGCDDEHACVPFSCSWISKRPPVCSACFAFLVNIRDEKKVAAVLEIFGIKGISNIRSRVSIAAMAARPTDDGDPDAERGQA